MLTDGDKLWFQEEMRNVLKELPCQSMLEWRASIDQRLDNGDTYDDKLTKYKEMSVHRSRLYISITGILVGFPTTCYTVLKILKLI